MNLNFKPNERELINVVNFFKRQSRKLIAEGKLGDEHRKLEETVDRFIEQMEYHANTRAAIFEQRDYLNKLVKDNAVCPRCHTRDMIKLVGTEKNDKGWKSNRYKCRKCNIQFTWNNPNNPWDMMAFLRELSQTLQQKADSTDVDPSEKETLIATIANAQGTLDKLAPVIEAHDQEYNDLQARDTEMEKLIHEFKNSLLIEKIKMDTWENKQKKNNP